MDTGSGHIFNMNEDEVKIKDIKGNLIQWKIGMEVECRGCKFKVIEIDVFPVNRIVLEGMAKASDILDNITR